jgi:5-methyltetrahydrofolate--homocysteine methyltransferase
MLERGEWDYVKNLAIAQVNNGASVIDINVDCPGIEESTVLPKIVQLISDSIDLPICIDSSDIQSIENALEVCGGKPLINSTTGDEKSLATILPLVKKYNAVIIGLCIDEAGISLEPEIRCKIAEKIIRTATDDYGIDKEDILIDPLALTVSTTPMAGVVSLRTAELIKTRLGVNMSIGSSNISYGLPDRIHINSSFISTAIWCGVNAPIVNPNHKYIVKTILATDLVMGKDPYAKKYIQNYRNQKVQSM